MTFERLADVPVGPEIYRQVLTGFRVPREFQGVPVVDLGQLSRNFRFADGSQEERLAWHGINAVLTGRNPVLSSVLGTRQGRPEAYFLSLGTPGSPKDNTCGGTLRAMWLPNPAEKVRGLFGLTLRPLSVDQDGNVRNEPIVGFRLAVGARLAPEVADLWNRLVALWRIPPQG